MPSNPPIILLDSMVVAGVFALTKSGNNIDERKNTYKAVIIDLVSILGKSYLLSVPTPVCFELMCWNEIWKNFVLNSKSQLFFFAKHSITSDVLQTAAEFSIKSNTCRYDEKIHKIKSLDSIIAAYGISNGHYILTENQKGFPESHFELIGSRVMLLKQHEGYPPRTFLYLLKPRKSSI
ncbi:MAG: hypothetical protein AAB929_04585 [Patescibacteria group bacterium]